MSGRSGSRGYLLQALVAVVESLEKDHNWTALSIEPDENAEKIDVTWEYVDRIKAVQVKSSENQIGKSDAERWAGELEAESSADGYELILLGPISQSVVKMGKHGEVIISPPRPLNMSTLVDQAAQRLGLLLEERGYQPLSSSSREIVVRALANQLGEFSTRGTRITRSDFEDLLLRWTTNIQPLQEQVTTANFRDQTVELTPEGGEAQVVTSSQLARRVFGFWVALISVGVACYFVQSRTVFGWQFAWVLIAGIAVFFLYFLNRDFLTLSSAQGEDRVRGVYLGHGRLARYDNGSFRVLRPVAEQCIYPDCSGSLFLTAPPPRAQPHQRYVAICTECGRDHSYRVYPNGRATPDPGMDWRAAPATSTQSQ